MYSLADMSIGADNSKLNKYEDVTKATVLSRGCWLHGTFRLWFVINTVHVQCTQRARDLHKGSSRKVMEQFFALSVKIYLSREKNPLLHLYGIWSRKVWQTFSQSFIHLKTMLPSIHYCIHFWNSKMPDAILASVECEQIGMCQITMSHKPWFHECNVILCCRSL